MRAHRLLSPVDRDELLAQQDMRERGRRLRAYFERTGKGLLTDRTLDPLTDDPSVFAFTAIPDDARWCHSVRQPHEERED